MNFIKLGSPLAVLLYPEVLGRRLTMVTEYIKALSRPASSYNTSTGQGCVRGHNIGPEYYSSKSISVYTTSLRNSVYDLGFLERYTDYFGYVVFDDSGLSQQN